MNTAVKNFFIELGFEFEKSLSKPDAHFLVGNTDLKEKLKNKVYFFDSSKKQTNTSFYLVMIPLQGTEFDVLRKYIWNENKADLIFYVSKTEEDTIDLYYSKISPLAECKLDTFKPANKDLEKIKQINRWQFESGAFWFNYHQFLKTTQKSIDKELIGVLIALKSKLYNAVAKVEKEKEEIEKIVQALIDRTLYIKYLEDNHIINSYFYTHYFKSAQIDYKTLLEQNKKKELNKLFKVIHTTFNNGLFDMPFIEDEFLTSEVCDLILHSLKGTNLVTNQLRLFDFQFDVIPVEFISYIYEIFLSDKQKKNGIYYTPKKLAQLIIDDVIIDDKIGKVLDPSCGSGMFLSIAFQKLLENSKEKNFRTIEKQIEHRTKLLSENIFGIEKEITAQRFTIFSLSLQLFRGLDPTKIKEYIANQLKNKGRVDLFEKFDLSQNIICANTLNQKEVPFEGITFDYLVGNPPFFEIKQTDEFKNEIHFLNNYKIEIEDKKIKAKDIVGKHQISQCFLLKIKDWSNENTRFGFVSNSSNFYNDNSKEFQNYFYSNYNIEKIYELSKVKKILFEKAKESVVTLIFSNQLKANNKVEYYPVDMGIFSEKPFELLIIQEDKIVELKQKELRENKIRLRDYLVGNYWDLSLIIDINLFSLNLEKIVKTDDNGEKFIHRGFGIWGDDARRKEFNISKAEWSKKTLKEKEILKLNFFEKYIRTNKKTKQDIAFIKHNSIKKFSTDISYKFINSITNFDRPRIDTIYEGSKILLSRFGEIKALFNNEKIYFDTDILVVKLEDESQYYLLTGILNSYLITYYTNLFLRKRLDGEFPKIGIDDLKQIPIPKEFDEDLVTQISKISKDLTEGKYQYSEKESELNELIFDLYDLSFIDKQRIKDYFLKREKVTKTKGELERYKATLIDTISLYFKDNIEIEFSNQNHNPIVAKIYFSKKKNNSPSAEKTAYYLLNEIFEQNPTENFLASQEKIYSNDFVYIIKDNLNTSWTETKAYEDGQDILKHIC